MKQQPKRTLVLDDRAVAYLGGRSAWRVPVGSIMVIGEATTPGGPLSEDYWLCFVTGRDGTWFEAPFYASGRDKLLHDLAARLGAGLELGLCNSTSYRSRVMWPPALAGAPLFEYVSPSQVEWWRRWLHRLGLSRGSMLQRVSPVVLAHLSETK